MASLLGEPHTMVHGLNTNIYGYTNANKLKLWEESSRNITGKNSYHVIHGGPKEGAEKMASHKLTCHVPENIIVVILAPPDTVMYGNSKDDLEVLTYVKNPNWIKTSYDGSSITNDIDPPKKGVAAETSEVHHREWHGIQPNEPTYFKLFQEQLDWADKRDENFLERLTLEGQMGILNGAQIFYPGDAVYDQHMNFDEKNVGFDSYYLEKPYTKRHCLDRGGNMRTHREMYWRDVVGMLSEVKFGFKGGYDEMMAATLEDERKVAIEEEFHTESGNLRKLRGDIKWSPNTHQMREAGELGKEPETFSFAMPCEEFGRDIHESIKKRAVGGQVTYNNLCEIMKLWSAEAKKTGGTVIHYLNACSPVITSEDWKDYGGKMRKHYNMSGLISRNQVRKDVLTSQILTSHNVLRDAIFELGRENTKYLRSHWIGHKDIPIPTKEDLPRIGRGVFRYMKEERHEWYVNVMGSYFKQLRSSDALGHEGLKILYKQSVRYDTSGMMRMKLKTAFDSANKNEGGKDGTWETANPHWKEGEYGHSQKPHWEDDWIAAQEFKRDGLGFRFHGDMEDYYGSTGQSGGNNLVDTTCRNFGVGLGLTIEMDKNGWHTHLRNCPDMIYKIYLYNNYNPFGGPFFSKIQQAVYNPEDNDYSAKRVLSDDGHGNEDWETVLFQYQDLDEYDNTYYLVSGPDGGEYGNGGAYMEVMMINDEEVGERRIEFKGSEFADPEMVGGKRTRKKRGGMEVGGPKEDEPEDEQPEKADDEVSRDASLRHWEFWKSGDYLKIPDKRGVLVIYSGIEHYWYRPGADFAEGFADKKEWLSKNPIKVMYVDRDMKTDYTKPTVLITAAQLDKQGWRIYNNEEWADGGLVVRPEQEGGGKRSKKTLKKKRKKKNSRSKRRKRKGSRKKRRRRRRTRKII